MKFAIAIILSLILYACKNSSTHEERLKVVNEILDKNCETLANVSSEFIKKDLVAVIVNAISSNRCRCIQEIIAPKMADAFTLEELEGLKQKPVQEILEVKNLIKDHKREINKCFGIK